MPVQYNKDSSLFQLDYQAPFGGMDTSAYSSAINEKNFANIYQGIVDANYLIPVAWVEILSQALAMADGEFLGYIPIAESSTIGYIITTQTVIVVASDGAGGVTYTSPSGAPYTPGRDTFGYFSYLVIQGQLIWTSETWSELWTYDVTTGVTSRLTDYVGGGYLGELDNQIINLGGVSDLDGVVPYRISWSAPGQYGQWQPYDVGSGTGNYAAGFNDLPSISDVLQGMMTIGTVAYLFRSQGITQMNPTGNGIEPFAFNHLWASQLGIGSVLPDSISQYGSLGAFVADSGIYTLGLSGLREISGVAKDGLFKQINNVANFATNSLLPEGIITGVCVPYLNNHPSVYYVLGILSSMTTAPSGVSPSVNTYNIWAIDLNGGNSCYNLGTLSVAVDSTVPSNYAVGRLSFINTSYSAAPSPAPPPTPSYSDWETVTYYTPWNVYVILPTSGIYNLAGLYSCTTSGTFTVDNDQPYGVFIDAPANVGDTVTVGSAVFTYLGGALWSPSTYKAVGQYTTKLAGTSPYQYAIAYKYTQAGITGGSQNGWSTVVGDTVNDGTAICQCVGIASAIPASNITPSNETSLTVASDSIIIDVNLNLQQNTNSTIEEYTWSWTEIGETFHAYLAIPGGFSQSAAPTWSTTTGGTTNETKTLTTPFPAGTWVCLGASPEPPATLVGENIQHIVPLFVAINDDLYTDNSSSFTALALDGSGSAIGGFAFKKEQLKFGYIPTVTKLGFVAALIDTTSNGTISCSVDGGLTFNTAFPDITIEAGEGNPGNGVYDNLYSDGVQSLQRPQLVIELTNVSVAEVWAQGTLDDFELI